MLFIKGELEIDRIGSVSDFCMPSSCEIRNVYRSSPWRMTSFDWRPKASFAQDTELVVWMHAARPYECGRAPAAARENHSISTGVSVYVTNYPWRAILF